MEKLKTRKIILASGSPRRKELLEGLAIDFEIDTRTSFEETYSPDTPHEQVPVLMSEGKSYSFHRELADEEILITSDTMVLCGNEILGKPDSHEVVTAVTLRDNRKKETFSDTAVVHFKELTDSEIEFYIEHFRPFDKAGAYGIQEWIGYIGITGIEGSFYTIMGLPVHLIYEHLLKF